MEYVVRKFKNDDEAEIVELIHRVSMEVNIRDYSKEKMERLCERINEEFIKKRSEEFHTYVITDEDKIIAVGTIGPYWNSVTESSLFNIFVLPEYQGKGIGRILIHTLESDEYYKRADRVEIPSSITAVEFYKHLGFGFKKLGNITDKEGHYKMEKFPKISNNNVNYNQYNMRIYIDNSFHNYKKFIYQVKKDAYKQYGEECFGKWNEKMQRELFDEFIHTMKNDIYIIQLNGCDIGFFSGKTLEDGSYEIENIYIIPQYQKRGIGTNVLKDVMTLHKDQDLYILYLKTSSVGKLYEKLGFIPNHESDFYSVMVKPKTKIDKEN